MMGNEVPERAAPVLNGKIQLERSGISLARKRPVEHLARGQVAIELPRLVQALAHIVEEVAPATL